MTTKAPNLCKRLWLGGGGVGLFILTLVLAGPFFDRSPDRGKLGLGYDFLPAYVAGHFARTGEFAKMYDRAAFSEMQTRVIRDADLEMDGRYGAGLNPPHFALMFAPLSALPYRTAATAWLAINVALLGGALALLLNLLPKHIPCHPGGSGSDPRDLGNTSGSLRPEIPRSASLPRDDGCQLPAPSPVQSDPTSWKVKGLVPLLVLASMPFCQAMGHQQNTFLSLFLLCATVTLWRGGRHFGAGVVCGMLFYKPQVALVVAIVLALDCGRRAVLGLGVTGVATLLLTVWVMPGALEEYARTLPLNVDWIQNRVQYNWDRQATFQGFWRLLLHGRTLGPSMMVRFLCWTSSFAVAAALAVVFFRTRRNALSSRDRLIAASIASTPLLIPYFMDYDLLLLAVPAVLYAADLMRSGVATSADRWTVRAWIALYAWAYLSPGLSGILRVSLTVPLLAAVATGLILRCLRPAPVATAGTPADAPQHEPRLAKAA